MPKKTRTRTVLVPIRKRARRLLASVGGWKGLVRNVMIGLGALAIGSMIASRTGFDPRITGGLLGLYFGGLVGAGTAVVMPTIMQRMQSEPAVREGQVWV
jgi:hypothetical protein